MFSFMKKKATGEVSKVPVKKSKGFYLELDEAKSLGTATPTEEVAKVEAPKVAAVETVKPEVPAPEVPPIAAKNSSPTTVTKTPEIAPEPKVVITTPEPATPPAFLQLLDTPRRRPGANMAAYKTMAQEVKTTKG